MQFWMVVDMPVGVQATGGRCPCCCSSSTSCGHPCDYAVTEFSNWMCLRFCSSTVWWIFQLPRRDWSHSAYCEEDRRFPRAVLGRSSTRPLVCKRQGYGSDSAENCGFRRCSALTRLDVPVIMQRRDVSQLEVSQIQSSPESADISVATETSSLSAWMAALEGFFADFPHFSCSSGFIPELSAMPISTAFVDIHIRLTLARV